MDDPPALSPGGNRINDTHNPVLVENWAKTLSGGDGEAGSAGVDSD